MPGTHARRPDWLTLAGIGVVALAAAVMSFSSLHALAYRAGFSAQLAALLPIAIDAMGVVAARAWLSGTVAERARRYARTLCLTAVAISIGGNAAEHYMATYTITIPWWVLVLVAAIPPASLAAVVHLAALTLTEPPRVASSAAPSSPPASPTATPATPPVEPTGADGVAGRSVLDSLPASVRTALTEVTEHAHQQGKAITAGDIAARVQLPEELTTAVVGELNARVNHHPVS